MANYEQIVLFDLEPYTIQQSAVYEEALDLRKVESLAQFEYKQLELNLFFKKASGFNEQPLKLAA
jgi:hypothetical protein